jgi:hypothetical protein
MVNVSKEYLKSHIKVISGVAQVVEHLLSKCEVLSSNPSLTTPAKKKKQMKKSKEVNSRL